jgi:inner membrane protein
MDNITHSLTGLAAGELLHRTLKPEPEPGQHALRHRLLLVTCAVASNFPDLDLLFSPLLPDPLGYLLHHRGHTHTLLYAIPQAILLAALIALLWPAARQLLRHSKTSRTGFGLALGIGLVLHIAMDYLNSYGVHPFHPFDSHWLYGDMVFIIEPVFWVAFGMPMLKLLPQRAVPDLPIIVFGAVLSLFAVLGFLPWTSFTALLVLAGVMEVAQRRAGSSGRQALVLAFAVCIGFVAIQGIALQAARRSVTAFIQTQDRASRVLDIALTAFPANPACWTFASVESNEQTGIYGLRQGIVSVAPSWTLAGDCPEKVARGGSAEIINASIALFSVEQGNLQSLRSLSRDNCHFNAWLRFARNPWLAGGEASDLRFPRNGNFTTIRLDDFKNRECPRYIPQWDFPREDLLKP